MDCQVAIEFQKQIFQIKHEMVKNSKLPSQLAIYQISQGAERFFLPYLWPDSKIIRGTAFVAGFI